MKRACVDCGRQPPELYEASIFDTGGVSHLELCRHCRERLERRGVIYQSTVCVRCSRHRNPSRADGLQFFGAVDGAEALHICDDCRLELLGMVSGDETPIGGVGRCRP